MKSNVVEFKRPEKQTHTEIEAFEILIKRTDEYKNRLNELKEYIVGLGLEQDSMDKISDIVNNLLRAAESGAVLSTIESLTGIAFGFASSDHPKKPIIPR